ncbi:DUF4190 domain-containing protein [Microcella sp.]|uniref:DUF4190 domain-containing protein n=1 Tax=Microcella sp. TaxID=1913979 RepID=UPI00255E0F56|nr:DUF4190 domain-containing protein [Microcella sp.]MBX9471087.1 DUF4190 domain-containing protein [Microcella sp.]
MNEEPTSETPDSTTPPPAVETPAYTAPVASASTPGKGMAITALIIGIVALLGVAIPVLNVFSAILAVVGLVLGIVALSKATSKGLPLSGVIVSGLALLLSIVFIVVYVTGFTNAVNDVRDDTSIIDEEQTDAEPQAPEEPAEAEQGTRDNPAPLGTTIEVSEFGQPIYELTMGPSTLDATALVLAENQFNEAPPEGFQYALVPVTVTYIGDESGLPWVDFTIEFVSAAGTTHTESDSFAVAPAPTFMDINDLFTGASGTGNIVILIPTENAAGGTWAVSTLFGDPFFFTAE